MKTLMLLYESKKIEKSILPSNSAISNDLLQSGKLAGISKSQVQPNKQKDQ